MNHFLRDVLKGLQSSPKYLESKYFYDSKGDALFQKIMTSDEYYLTNAEMEIFSNQSSMIADQLLLDDGKISVVEFGPGDAVKSIHLLRELSERKMLENYYPIDISPHIIELLEKEIPKKIPGVSISGFTGEYLQMLSQIIKISSGKKVILFLGANIGNFKIEEVGTFFTNLKQLISSQDLVLVGFDLKKNPQKILDAYNDREGHTAAFNLNLLERINRELSGNFEVNDFEHYAAYDPLDGACKSFLISKKKQQVIIGNQEINFEKDEPLFMEISQKYSLEEISRISQHCGFQIISLFRDQNGYFVDVLLKKVDEQE